MSQAAIDLLEKMLAYMKANPDKFIQGHLNDGCGMCSIGVACDIIDSDAWCPKPSGIMQWDGNSVLVPWRVRKELGNFASVLMAVNDNNQNKGYPIHLIEQELDRLRQSS